MNSKTVLDISTYIASYPLETQKHLNQIYFIIKNASAEITESISYAMPAFKLHGALIYFAAYKNHIGLYPTGSAIKSFASKLKKYKTSKGTIQFPLDEPLPLELIKEIVNFRMQENIEKQKLKKNKK